MKQAFDILVIGGGAAGFFTAINAAELLPTSKICILERGKEVLTKVRVSGGGRCNVTHAEFLPKELSKNYPRGEKELLGPFHQFMTGDTIEWFEKRGVELKIEDDGRMFPTTDSSETIIDCFLKETKRLGVEVRKNQPVQQVEKEGGIWKIGTKNETLLTKKLVFATGSNPKIWKLLKGLGHNIVPPVPSLFTFNIKDERIVNLPGISTQISVKVMGTKLESKGPVLITHWGMSGPAVLKLSAWGAKELNEKKYTFSIQVNWLAGISIEECLEKLKTLKKTYAKQQVSKRPQFELPKRLWQSLAMVSEIPERSIWAELNKKQLRYFAEQLTRSVFKVKGKSTFKEEFVTAGGVELSEVDFRTFQSKIHKNLYFAGEILNIDAITGGFNFQNAWTGGFLAAKSLGTDD